MPLVKGKPPLQPMFHYPGWDNAEVHEGPRSRQAWGGERLGDLRILLREMLVDTSTLSRSLCGWNDHPGGVGDTGVAEGGDDCACWHSASGRGGFGSPWPGIWNCGLERGGNPSGRSAGRLSLRAVPGQRLGVAAPGCFNAI